MIEAAAAGDSLPAKNDIAGDVIFDRPAVDADCVRKACALKNIVFGELIVADNPARLADAQLRRQIDDIGVGERRNALSEKIERLPDLPAPFDLTIAQLVGIRAVDGASVLVTHLGDVGAPFDAVLLRADDRRLSRKLASSLASRRLHQTAYRLPSPLRFSIAIDVVDT